MRSLGTGRALSKRYSNKRQIREMDNARSALKSFFRNMNIMLIRCLLVAKSGTSEQARFEHLTDFQDNIL